MTDTSEGSIVALFTSLDQTSYRSDRHISAEKSRASESLIGSGSMK